MNLWHVNGISKRGNKCTRRIRATDLFEAIKIASKVMEVKDCWLVEIGGAK